ncbi:hypothetical protein D9M73_176170 [compost metagenome]
MRGVIQVARHAVGHQDGFKGRALFAPDARQAEIDLMAHRARTEVTVQAGHCALVVFVVGRIEKAHLAAAVVVHIQRRVLAVFPGVLGAAAGIQRPVVAQVVLAVDHAVGVFELRPGPVLGVVVLGRRWVRDLGADRVHHRAAVVDEQFLIAQVGGQAQALAAVIQGDGDQR